jgi:hypothetical protein
MERRKATAMSIGRFCVRADLLGGRGDRALFGSAACAAKLAVAHVRLLLNRRSRRLLSVFASAVYCPFVCLQPRLGLKMALAPRALIARKFDFA